MKPFYPLQLESVFTNNNWTLSREVISIFHSNEFYQQHVRWNTDRFGSSDTTATTPDPANAEDSNSPGQQANHHTQQCLPKQSNANEEEDDEAEDFCASSAPTRLKRKTAQSDYFHEHDTRTQSRKLKKQ
jgi:hypothetical protein